MSAVRPLGWDTLRAAVPAECRAIPLAKLILPSRIENYAERIGLRTLGELADRSEAEILAEPYLGRLSLHRAFVSVRDHLARTGSHLATASVEAELRGPALRHPKARARAQRAAPVPAPRDREAPRNWDALRASLPASCLATPLDDMILPTAVSAYAMQAGLRTLGDLAGCSRAELLAAPHIGPGTLRRLCVEVRHHLASPRPRLVVRDAPRVDPGGAWGVAGRARVAARPRVGRGLLASWGMLRGALDPLHREVMERRAGLVGPGEALDAIAEAYGLSRERARQIEEEASAALLQEEDFFDEVRARVDATLVDGAVPLASVAHDPWWAGAAEQPEAIDYYGVRLLGGSLRIVELAGEKFVARFSPKALETAWEKLRACAERAPTPAPLAAFHALIDPFQDRFGTAAAEVLIGRLEALLHVEDDGGEPVVTGVRRPRLAPPPAQRYARAHG